MPKGELVAKAFLSFFEDNANPIEIKKEYAPKLIEIKDELIKNWKKAVEETEKERIWIHTYHNSLVKFLVLTEAFKFIPDFANFLASYPIPIERAVIQAMFSWFNYDITRDLYFLQKRLKQVYTEKEIRETIALGMMIAGVPKLRGKEKASQAIKQGMKYIKNFFEFEDGYGEIRAIVFVENWNIVYIYLYNEETINLRKPLISVADILTLSEEKLKEKAELAKLGMPTEFVDYGVGINLDREEYSEYGSMPFRYFDLPFPFGLTRARGNPYPTIEVFD